ncbi:site-2 protease family protein [Halogeometricum borinquense]|uniref:Site-2 protease family protein n=1 Tax=Halogeometricum borinquense TaxID=60847 RepID=A0A6C0UL75_9EURY|nr:site-2 protease family protein [Halogeometricum borinquense]QIB75950.1 site-2 protease family protein [Halogeometricum borinquense]QIQ75467.1 site-2 protease family protein [Halogeometricum borinquense]
MDPVDSAEIPPIEALQSVFSLHETRRDGERILYYGESLVPEQMLVREVWPSFRQAGYEIQVATTPAGREDIIVARPVTNGTDGIPWKNLGLFFATVLSTMIVGALAWYHVPGSEILSNPATVLQAWPFTAAVLGVLTTHELGHYALSRYHGVDVSLPYLIPFIVPFGTLGAIIQMRGQIPDRKALFDIGVAGPLAGLAATIVVTAVGLSLPPMTVPESMVRGSGQVIVFNNPPLLNLIAAILGEQTSYPDPTTTAHPVIIGGWVGMFFTVLNLLPVGQLDGGHIIRAMLGEAQERLAAFVPIALFGLAAYLHYSLGYSFNESVGIWAFWGFLSIFIAYRGPADPIDDAPIGPARMAVGLLTFALGALCFLLVPIEVMTV